MIKVQYWYLVPGMIVCRPAGIVAVNGIHSTHDTIIPLANNQSRITSIPDNRCELRHPRCAILYPTGGIKSTFIYPIIKNTSFFACIYIQLCCLANPNGQRRTTTATCNTSPVWGSGVYVFLYSLYMIHSGRSYISGAPGTCSTTSYWFQKPGRSTRY